MKEGFAMKALRRISLLALVISFLTIKLCYAENVAEQHWSKGVEYAAQGKFKEAEGEFEKALKVDPSYGPAKSVLKMIEDLIDQKIKTKTAVHLFRGISHRKKENWDESVAEFTKAIEIDPRYADAYNGRGLAYTMRAKFEQAISDYTKAIEIDPRFAEAYSNRGHAYNYQGQYNKAISDLNKALEINPGYAGAYNNRAIAYFLKREYDKAWDDVYEAQNLGYQVHPGFLKALRRASRRQR